MFIVKKTHEIFLNQMQEINKNIKILSKYEKDNIKVKCKCMICDFEWESTPSNLLQGKGCKKCHFNKLSELKRKSHEDFINDILKVNKNIEVLSKYSGVYNKVKCRCLLHGTEFSINAGHLLRGETSCSECIKIKFHLGGLKSHEQFVKDLNSANKNIQVIGKYNGAKNRIEVKCLKCGYIWNPTAGSLLGGNGCPHCKRSKGEEKIEEYLNDNNITYETQKKFADLRNINPLSYDFYLPEFNMLIEYQGQFHDGTASIVNKDLYFERQKINDELKRNYAKENGYNFLEIWYYDYDKVEYLINKFIYNLKNPVTTTVA